MKRNYYLYFSLFPVMIGTTVALILAYCNPQYSEETMTTHWNDPIIIALISVVGTIITLICTQLHSIAQNKKDSTNINKGVEGVKNDTNHMLPLVDNIARESGATREDILRNILPTIKGTSKISEDLQKDIKLLVEEQNYQKRGREENIKVSPDVIHGEIDNMFAENAGLREQQKRDNQLIAQLRHENATLKNQVNTLSRELAKYQRQPSYNEPELEL